MAETIKIGIWGGSGSGKTTFLAALRIAILKYAKNMGTQWNINGLDELHANSSAFLEENTHKLRSGIFPDATSDDKAATYSYEINGSLPGGHWLKNIVNRNRDVQFILDVLDYPGGALLAKDADNVLWEYLAECQGLIYLFDPKKTEIGNGNFDCLQHSLDMIRRVFVRKNLNSISRGRLPQHLALCITKFDDTRILERLLDQNLIAYDGSDPSYPPVVQHPYKAFEHLADDLTVQVVKGYFHEERIQYFGTSSIGFYVDPQTGRVDTANCSNIRIEREEYKDSVGKIVERELFKIKGPVNPVGVFEPLFWLHQSLS